VFVVNVASGETRQITDGEGEDSAPAWSPDGARVAFAKSSIDRESMETVSHVMMMDVASGESSRFTNGDKDSGPRFSPDGKSLAFSPIARDGSRYGPSPPPEAKP